MLKNLILYRLGPEWPTSADQLVEALAGEPFAPCAATQQNTDQRAFNNAYLWGKPQP